MALARHVIALPESIRAKAPLLKHWSQRIRSRHLFVLDTLGLFMAAIVALVAWQSLMPGIDVLGPYLWIVGITVCTHIVLDILLGLYTHSWWYASIGDMGRILACTFLGTAAAALIVYTLVALNPPTVVEAPPPAFWLIEATLALGVLATPRFLIRATSDLNDHSGHAPAPDRQRTLLYGAGWAGVMVARSAERNPASGVLPVGYLDDNPDLTGRRVSGLQVYGDVRALARAKRQTRATSLLITMPNATGASVRRVVEAAMEQGLDVRTVPAFTDLIDGSIDATLVRQVRVEDLLRRPTATEHSPEVLELMRGQTVMITGAAGSIGSELVRQIMLLEPRRIVMVDQAESAMYMVARDLETRSQVEQGKTTITTHLVDVTDRRVVRRLMCESKPVVVFHAAAYKHVPMLEEHAAQAARVNLGGTQSVVDAAIECGVERFVLVSTDKAVRPSSVMGATKHIAEMIVSDAARRTGHAFVSVRFGNVLGSNGSVIPVFQSQLENGQPLTITDPEMTRYFMTIPEAAWLILDAAALSGSGSLYVLDMDEPVRILDVATDLIRLSGRDPDSVPIKFIGLRPGEKLHEELFYDRQSVTPTRVPKVLRSLSDLRAPATIQGDVDGFLALAQEGREPELRAGLLDFVRSDTDLVAIRVERARDGDERPWSEDGYRPVVPVPVHSNGNAPDGQRADVGTRLAGTNGHDRQSGRAVANGAARNASGNGHAPVGKFVVKPPAVVDHASEGASAAADAAHPETAHPETDER